MIDRKTERERGWRVGRQTDTERQTFRKRVTETDRQTTRQTEEQRETDRQINGKERERERERDGGRVGTYFTEGSNQGGPNAYSCRNLYIISFVSFWTHIHFWICPKRMSRQTETHTHIQTDNLLSQKSYCGHNKYNFILYLDLLQSILILSCILQSFI